MDGFLREQENLTRHDAIITVVVVDQVWGVLF